MTYTTAVELTPEMLATACEIGEALINTRKGNAKARAAALDAFRIANRASRERWGDDLHEVIKARGLMGATGGRA
jgi:hypothetical protein